MTQPPHPTVRAARPAIASALTRLTHLLFRPILAGASLRDRLVACLGASAGIAATAAIVYQAPFTASDLPLLIAPIGASAVLLFAVPASPLAQPWPILGGNIVSAFVGVAAAQLVPHAAVAAGVAVAGAIFAMSLLRCLHPPGGAIALTAVIGGPAILSSGYAFALFPVGANSLVLLLTGWLFHRFSGHAYPHRVAPAAGAPALAAQGLDPGDVERALADLGETFDISREDLDLLLARAEFYAVRRRAQESVHASVSKPGRLAA